MRHLIFLALATFASSVFAGDKILAGLKTAPNNTGSQIESAEPALTAGPTYYDSIAEWFKQGTNVSIDEMRGTAWSGRCFHKWNENMSLNSEIVSYEKDNEDVGPGFPAPNSPLYIGSLAHIDGAGRYLPPDFFDHGDDLEQSRQITANGVDAGQLSSVATTETGALTWTFDLEPNRRVDLRYTVKKYQDYLVLEGENLIAGNSFYSGATGRVQSRVALGPWQYCYYFKKLAP